MSHITIPEGYQSLLGLYDTQKAIGLIKTIFQEKLCMALHLKRVTAPLFVMQGSGLNDDLNGVERPVSFDVPSLNEQAEVVHSLAKWKRYALYKYGFRPGQGIVTDMNAVRRDEELDNLHSIYVDQWDWERVITADQRTLEFLQETVRSDVDFVLTFEELAGIIEAKDLDLDSLEVDPAEMDLCYASAAGRGFAQSGGVAKAVADKIKEWRPDMEVKIASAQGLADCKKLLMLAKAGKYNGYLLEGMGCPGGCIGGAGTIADPARTAVQLNKYIKEAPFTDPEQSAFMSNIHVLKDDPDFEL